MLVNGVSSLGISSLVRRKRFVGGGVWPVDARERLSHDNGISLVSPGSSANSPVVDSVVRDSAMPNI